jgi:hypothetical protein
VGSTAVVLPGAAREMGAMQAMMLYLMGQVDRMKRRSAEMRRRRATGNKALLTPLSTIPLYLTVASFHEAQRTASGLPLEQPLLASRLAQLLSIRMGRAGHLV